LSKKIMLINATDPEEIRVAILKGGILSDFDIEFLHNEKLKGNIYKAKVVRIDQSLQAAFVHYGTPKNGFLPIAELPKDLTGPNGRRGRIHDLLQKDQEIMVQVVREELGTKGAMVTAQISLPGRYLVLTPGNAINGISRKIESSEEREHFKKLVDELDVPSGMGVIVRSASLGVTKADFEKDLKYLLDTYKEAQSLYARRTDVGLVWQEDDVVTRTLRDTWTPEIEEIHIDDLETFQAAQGFFRRTMPQHLNALRHYTGKKPIFSKFQTEEQIDKIYARRVPLPSGGAIVLDQTEALVAIDVNSGKTTGDNQEETALRTNLEAAEEIATQLRLRDLAGLVVIDFIDCKRETNNKAIMDRLVECLREDKARMEVGKINRFGVLVMTRQRIRPSIQHVTHEPCPMCQGTGQVKNSEALVLSVLRRIKSVLSRNSTSKIHVRLFPAIAMNLLNNRRHEIVELENGYETTIAVSPDHGITYGEISIEMTRKEEEPEHKPKESHERKRDAEDETVVLGGDAPISFNKALADAPDARQNGHAHAHKKDHQPKNQHESAAKMDAPDTKRTPEKHAQAAPLPERAHKPAPDERNKLLNIFGNHGADAKTGAKAETKAEAKPGTHTRTLAGHGKAKKKKDGTPALPAIEPPRLSADVIASLAVPANLPRKLMQPGTAEPSLAPRKGEGQTSGKPAKKTGPKPGPDTKSQGKAKNQGKPAEPKKSAKAEAPAGAGKSKSAPKKGENAAKKVASKPKAAPTAAKAKPTTQSGKKPSAKPTNPSGSQKTARAKKSPQKK